MISNSSQKIVRYVRENYETPMALNPPWTEYNSAYELKY